MTILFLLFEMLYIMYMFLYFHNNNKKAQVMLS